MHFKILRQNSVWSSQPTTYMIRDGTVSLPQTLLTTEARESPCFKPFSFFPPPPLPTAEFCRRTHAQLLRDLANTVKAVRQPYPFSNSRWQNFRCLLSMSTSFRKTTQQRGKQMRPSVPSLHQCTNLSLAARAPLYGLLLRACWRCSGGCTWGIPQRSFVPAYRPEKNSPHQEESVKMSKESKGDSRELSAYFAGRSSLSFGNMRASAKSL